MIPLSKLDGLSQAELLNEIDRQRRLKERAQDYPGVKKYVREVWDVDDFALSLERMLDDLDRGYSDALDGFAEWRNDRRRAKKQAKRDLILLAEAGDKRLEELQDEIENGDLTFGDLSRLKRELKALHGAVYRLWERVQA